jgi:hypothetical protein
MRRRHRRRRRHNAWFGHSRAHRRAARRGSRRRHHNPRRRRHRGRRWFNPAGILTSSPVKAITSGFSIPKLTDAGLIVAGGVANAWASKQLKALIPVTFLQTPPGYYITGLVSAGLVGAGAGMVLPRYASQLFTGSLVQVLLKVAEDYLPFIKGLSDYFTGATPIRRTMGDFYSGASQVTPLMAGIGADLMQESVYGSDLF